MILPIIEIFLKCQKAVIKNITEGLIFAMYILCAIYYVGILINLIGFINVLRAKK